MQQHVGTLSPFPQGELVYVNYGSTEDFFQLQRQMNVNVTGKIVIVRYGKIFRGNKVGAPPKPTDMFIVVFGTLHLFNLNDHHHGDRRTLCLSFSLTR